MKFLGIILALFLILQTDALQAQNEELLQKYSILKGDAVRIADEARSSRISGSPYREKEFHEGHIYFKDHAPLAVDLRYDIVNEEMQLLTADNEKYQVLQDGVDVSIKGVDYQKLNYRGEDGNMLLGYFEVVTAESKEKPVFLLKKYFKHVKSGTRSEARGFPPKYVDKSELFLKFENSRLALPAENRLDSFLEAFPQEHRKELHSYIKNNKLKTRRLEDLEQIVAHYNQVIQ